MKIKKDGVIINLTESDLKKLGRALLSEASYAGGVIQGADSLCEILCGNKLAKISKIKAEGVGKIQNALHAGRGVNPPYQDKKYNDARGGGGMSANCGTSEDACDDWFDKHTRDAVIEFQTDYFGPNGKNIASEIDGVVGTKTLKAMVEVGLLKLDCNCDDFKGDDKGDEKGGDQRGKKPIYGDWSIDDLLAIDCNTLKNCLIALLQDQKWENIKGTDFMAMLIKCIAGGSSTTKTIERPIEEPKSNKCAGCPKTINAAEMVKLTNYTSANSEKYQRMGRCIESGCTKIDGGAEGAAGATGVTGVARQ